MLLVFVTGIDRTELCDCVSVDPLLHSGGCDVDGCRGCTDVPENCDCICICPDYHTMYHCFISHMLGYDLIIQRFYNLNLSSSISTVSPLILPLAIDTNSLVKGSIPDR